MQATTQQASATRHSTPDTDQHLLTIEDIRVLKTIYITGAMPFSEAAQGTALRLMDAGHITAHKRRGGHLLLLSEATKARIIADIILRNQN